MKPNLIAPNSTIPGAPDRGRIFCGDIDIRIDRNGVWYYGGSPIGRKEMVCLFASVLNRDDLGDYWLITPAEMARIRVEDAPFLAVEMAVQGSGPAQTLSFRTNVDEWVTADAAHPLRIETDPVTGEPSPYILVRPGLEARLTRAVFYELVGRGIEERENGKDVYGVWSSERFFPIGTLDGV